MRTIIALLALCLCASAQAQNYENCKGFIDYTCCCTNECCWEIDASEITALPNGKVKVNATGQEIDFKPSQDGKWYRCACDQINGAWVKHELANTRCIYGWAGF